MTRSDSFASNPVLRRYWHPVARADEIRADPVAVELLHERLVLWRDGDGALGAAYDRCPHRESPLSVGHVVDGCLQCPYHGWSFAVTGACVRVPSSPPDVPVPPKARLATVHLDECYGLVWVCLDEPAAPIPVIAEDNDPAFRRINNPVERWRASATRMTDNFMDISHFPFVHVGTFGRAQNTLVPKIDMQRLDDSFYGYRYEVEVNNPDQARVTSGQATDTLTRTMTTGFNLPFLSRSTIRYETGLEHILLLCTTPIDDVTSYFTFVVWRNDDFSVPAEEVVAFDRAIGAEDKVMLERVPGVLALDLTATVSVQSDKPSVEWRRRLIELLRGGVTRPGC
jgi:phenylpropionate dioxygenase-like ring-hydroxylating dioxygenase large terminal subunit